MVTRGLHGDRGFTMSRVMSAELGSLPNRIHFLHQSLSHELCTGIFFFFLNKKGCSRG